MIGEWGECHRDQPPESVLVGKIAILLDNSQTAILSDYYGGFTRLNQEQTISIVKLKALYFPKTRVITSSDYHYRKAVFILLFNLILVIVVQQFG